MVNEVNKPASPENIILGERLAASHRQLQEMQEEHRQLLQEMEMLRRRAAELSRLNAQQDELYLNRANTMTRNAQTLASPAVNTSTNATEPDNKTSVPTDSTSTSKSESEVISQAEPCGTPAQEIPTEATTNDDIDPEKDDPETAEYLQEKLAEIAALKARYKRVQNMMNTTELIEKHMGSKDASATASTAAGSTPTATTSKEAAPTENLPPGSGNTQSANEELLSTMMNMFTDFTSDLRSQAEDLRAERDRIRALKEDMLLRKRQS